MWVHRYLALHNTHGPVEAPAEFEHLYAFPSALQNKFDGMVSVVDSTVANVTAALEAAGMWSTTLFIWTAGGSPSSCSRAPGQRRGDPESSHESLPRINR